MGAAGDVKSRSLGAAWEFFAPVRSWLRGFAGLFVYGFGFFTACLSFDYLPWFLALPATIGGLALIAIGLFMAEGLNGVDRPPLRERIAERWRS